MFLLQSCIVADPPEYRDPVQTRPLLDAYKAVPITQQVLLAYTADTVGIPISVPVRSEDAGEDLLAHFYLDYGTLPQPGISLGEQPLRVQRIPASTYIDSSRSASYQGGWKVKATTGCHLLTLIVAHASSFQRLDQDHLDPIRASSDAAIINWWVNVNPTLDTIHTLTNCPVSGPQPQ